MKRFPSFPIVMVLPVATALTVWAVWFAAVPEARAQQAGGASVISARASNDQGYMSKFTWQPGGTREEEMWQVLLLFGATDQEPASWDGSLRVTAGEALGVFGYRFEPPDRVLPEGCWRIRTQDVRILTASPLAGHGTPSTENAILPKGLLIRGRGSSATKVAVETVRASSAFLPWQ